MSARGAIWALGLVTPFSVKSAGAADVQAYNTRSPCSVGMRVLDKSVWVGHFITQFLSLLWHEQDSNRKQPDFRPIAPPTELRPNPHSTRTQIYANSFVPCVQCEHSHSQQQVPWACFLHFDWAWPDWFGSTLWWVISRAQNRFLWQFCHLSSSSSPHLQCSLNGFFFLEIAFPETNESVSVHKMQKKIWPHKPSQRRGGVTFAREGDKSEGGGDTPVGVTFAQGVTSNGNSGGWQAGGGRATKGLVKPKTWSAPFLLHAFFKGSKLILSCSKPQRRNTSQYVCHPVDNQCDARFFKCRHHTVYPNKFNSKLDFVQSPPTSQSRQCYSAC